MKEVSESVFLVVDSGLFLPLAVCLAEQAKHVLYWNPDTRPFPSVKQACIGSGFDNIERVRDLWPVLPTVDCCVFPDIGHAALQRHLVEIGKPVWGSRGGDILEANRQTFMRTLASLGMQVPEFTVKTGLKELAGHLRGVEDKYIKISRFRGDMETTHWRSWDLDEGWIDWLASNFGPLKEEITFLVFDAIDTNLEIGQDTYCVDGQWPDKMLLGLEGKDKCLFSAVTATSDMPPQLQEVTEKFGPVLKRHGYRNQFSSELRIKGDKSYFLDFTARGGMPSSGSQQLIWKNFPEIILAGAHGELVQPEPVANFSIECMITTKSEKESWDSVVIDKELLPWARFSECCKLGERYVFPPNEFHSGDLGWLVALGNTPTETLDRAKQLADMLPDGLNADVEALSSIIKEAEEMEKHGIPFTQKPLPEQAAVLE